jgi:hypothetical protein
MKCDESCCAANEAKYLLINGEERERCCEPGLKDRLLDLVTNNETVLFRLNGNPSKEGLLIIRVG